MLGNRSGLANLVIYFITITTNTELFDTPWKLRMRYTGQLNDIEASFAQVSCHTTR